MTYAAPLADMRFTLATIAGLEGEAAEIADAILDEAARFAAAELAPLNQPADRVGSVLENGVVRTPAGFRDAYRRYVEGGWMGLAVDPAHGGQGLPGKVSRHADRTDRSHSHLERCVTEVAGIVHHGLATRDDGLELVDVQLGYFDS